MSATTIKTEPMLDGQGLRIVLNAPKGNVLSATMMGELNAVLDSLASQQGLKLLCFCGEGEHFSFGASVAEHVRDKAPGMLELFHGMFRRLMDLAIPTAAAVRGRCLGGGMELAAFCHRLVAHPGASFGQPEIQLGVLPPIASLILPARLGQGRADDLVLTGRTVQAPEAHAMGLVDELADDPIEAIERWAQAHLSPRSASSLRWTVRASRWSMHQLLNAELGRIEKMYLNELMATHDANEGLEAFLGKRRAEWKNR